MNMRSTLAAIATLTALAGCGASQSTNTRANTGLGQYCGGLSEMDLQDASSVLTANVARVEPIYREHPIVRMPQGVRTNEPAYVEGAALYVPAERGVTAAYMQRTLSCRAAKATPGVAHPNDPLGVEGIEQIRVVEADGAFRVEILGTRDSGETILRRARALSGGDTRVEVRQVAASGATPSRAL